MRLGGVPYWPCNSGTAISSMVVSNMETRMSAPLPVRPAPISASRIAS
jgi:hypothetical protein